MTAWMRPPTDEGRPLYSQNGHAIASAPRTRTRPNVRGSLDSGAEQKKNHIVHSDPGPQEAEVLSESSLELMNRYRSARLIPFELRHHCEIYFSEELYSHAIDLLLSLLTAGTVSSGPAYVAPPQLLAIAATLVVHPSTTTRAKTVEHQQAANAALQLLTLTNKLVGSASSQFDLAFTFTHFSSSRHGGRRRAHAAEIESGDDGNAALDFDMARSGSLWARAEDFWHVVGWAFNCSMLHPKRWVQWRLWLQFMCQAMEDDWNWRLEQLDNQSEEQSPDPKNEKTRKKERDAFLKQSLIFKYLADVSSVSGQPRRILRAIFADGSSASTNEFKEVFRNEPQELQKDKNRAKKREAIVNIWEDEYGDYMSGDEEEEDEPSAGEAKQIQLRTRPKRTKRGPDPSSSSATDADAQFDHASTGHQAAAMPLGGTEVLEVRQRLLALLSTVSDELPEAFIPIPQLYHLFVEFIRHLPFTTFQRFVSPSLLPHFAEEAQVSLCEMLLVRMLESTAPTSTDAYMSRQKLIECYLPYAANAATVAANAKISILLESLLRLLAFGSASHTAPVAATSLSPDQFWNGFGKTDGDTDPEEGPFVVTPELLSAVEQGIEARSQKALSESARSSRKMEGLEWGWLIESGERMLFLVRVLIGQHGVTCNSTD